MKTTYPFSKITLAIALTLTVSSCARFSERTQAESHFNYLNDKLINKYNTGEFSREEQRSTFDITALTEEQKKLGLLGNQVDVRPPTQLIPVLDGVLLDPDPIQTKVWFNAFAQEDNIEQTIWDLMLEYLAFRNATSMTSDRAALTFDTGPLINERVYGRYSKNYVYEEGNYKLQLFKGGDALSLGMSVDVQSYQELNDDVPIAQILEGETKRSIELAFINDVMKFAFMKKESEALKASDGKPLPIKLGFDDSHQTAWIIGTNFLDTWMKLPKLLSLMSFTMVEEDQNLGYFLVDFDSQNAEYWTENNLNPIELEEGEYFVQLGEMTGGDTSVLWLNADKQPLSDQQITDLYLSITSNIRSVVLEKDTQSVLY
ncbi:outer membrane protein assembly factor BamC [Psychromonas sp.]|nr:outer membrane protein assembly factor BamC [Psychromonas sp.]